MIEANSESDSSSYEWVYYDVEECKSCSSSSSDSENGYRNSNSIVDANGEEWEYYDEVDVSENEEDKAAAAPSGTYPTDPLKKSQKDTPKPTTAKKSSRSSKRHSRRTHSKKA